MSIIENTWSQLNQNKFCRVVFFYLMQWIMKSYWKKLSHYGIRRIENEWFCSYLTKQNQYVIIGNHIGNINRSSQGSVVVSLLYINDLYKGMKYSKTYHFADGTSTIQSNASLQILSKRINKGLSNLSK